MSHYSSISVNYIAIEDVVAALVAAGCPREVIEVHTKPAFLRDFRGNPTTYMWNDLKDARFKDGDKAHVIIRKKDLGGPRNDMGFFIDSKNGSRVIIDDYSIGQDGSMCKIPEAVKAGGYKKWAETTVKREYVVITTSKLFRSQGKVPIRQEGEDGKIRVYRQG